MKRARAFLFAAIVLVPIPGAAAVGERASASATDHPVISVDQSVPGDGTNTRALRKELERPGNFPAFVQRPDGATRSRAGRYLLDGRVPTGPMQCEHVRFFLGKSDELLAWEAHDTAASNAYFHIHRAIDYFAWLESRVGEPIPRVAWRETRPVNVRVRMDIEWAMWIKFSSLPRYNTSQTLPDADPDKWNTTDEQREIWFYAPKRKYLPRWIATTWFPGIRDTIVGTAGFPLDSARVPSIIYHEWTHLMTSPFLGIARNTVLNEGFSDYFGSVIYDRPEMGDTQDFSTFPYHRRYDRAPSPATVEDHREPGVFMPRLLWRIRKTFGDERGDVLAWHALSGLKPESRLAELPAALIGASSWVLGPGEVEELRALLGFFLPSELRRKGD